MEWATLTFLFLPLNGRKCLDITILRWSGLQFLGNCQRDRMSRNKILYATLVAGIFSTATLAKERHDKFNLAKEGKICKNLFA